MGEGNSLEAGLTSVWTPHGRSEAVPVRMAREGRRKWSWG